MRIKSILVIVCLLICCPLFLFAADYYRLTGGTDPGEYANCNGNYYIEGYTIGARPVYKHETYNFYIWWDSGYWVIDKDLEPDIAGYFLNNSDNTPPEQSYSRDTATGNNPTLTKIESSPEITFINGANGGLNFQQENCVPPKTNWLCGQFSLTGNETGATFNSVTVTLSGSYDSGDLQSTPFQIYASNSNSFSGASALGNSTADPGSGHDITFSSLDDAIPSGTRYYWVTVDISESATGDDTMNGTIDSSSDLNISSGTISGSSTYGKLNAGSDGSLPVSISSFSAHNEGLSIVLEWVTESEVDNLGFILERSENENSWQIIASYKTHDDLKGQGNVSFSTEYTFTDNNIKPERQYWYRLSDVDIYGRISVHAPITIIVDDMPKLTKLGNAYPNPFNSQTYISYQLMESGNVNISVFDLTGRRVSTLVNMIQRAGHYNVYWNGLNDKGMSAASGTYIIRMKTDNITRIQRVQLMK